MKVFLVLYHISAIELIYATVVRNSIHTSSQTEAKIKGSYSDPPIFSKFPLKNVVGRSVKSAGWLVSGTKKSGSTESLKTPVSSLVPVQHGKHTKDQGSKGIAKSSNTKGKSRVYSQMCHGKGKLVRRGQCPKPSSAKGNNDGVSESLASGRVSRPTQPLSIQRSRSPSPSLPSPNSRSERGVYTKQSIFHPSSPGGGFAGGESRHPALAQLDIQGPATVFYDSSHSNAVHFVPDKISRSIYASNAKQMRLEIKPYNDKAKYVARVVAGAVHITGEARHLGAGKFHASTRDSNGKVRGLWRDPILSPPDDFAVLGMDSITVSHPPREDRTPISYAFPKVAASLNVDGMTSVISAHAHAPSNNKVAIEAKDTW